MPARFRGFFVGSEGFQAIFQGFHVGFQGLQGFTADFKVFKPNLRYFWSDFKEYRDFMVCRDFRLDFTNFRSDFRSFVHRISEVVGPS